MKDISIFQYKPESKLIVEQHEVIKPKFPVIDFHTHYMKGQDLEKEIAKFKKYGVVGIVNLGNFWGDTLDEILEFTGEYHDNIITFGSVDFSKIDEPDFAKYASATIKESYRKGMKGIKVFKTLGLKIKDSQGRLIRIDDDRLKSVWETASLLNIPVLIHVADPLAYFDPLDEKNERYKQVSIHPDWHFFGPEYPSVDELMEMQDNLVKNNPDTIFVFAHMLVAENLGYVSQQMDKYPNMYVDISARNNELGRQPYTARDFICKYQDRILFGTDGGCYHMASDIYKYYYRLLETWDEYFDCNNSSNNHWKCYGLGLPDEVLQKIYYKNAIKLVPELAGAINK